MSAEQPGPSTGPLRCLVCGVLCEVMHLGIGCRACTVFFRRGRQREKPFACRTGKRECDIDRGDAGSDAACKRCRFDKFDQLYKESGGSVKEKVAAVPSVSLTSTPTSSLTPRPIMERLSRSYETFLSSRIAGELKILNERKASRPLHEITTFARGDKDIYLQANQFCVVALHDLIKSFFIEFVDFAVEDQRYIIENFHDSVHLIEGSYRTIKYFKGNRKIFIRGLIFYYHMDYLDEFFTGSKGDVDSAKKILHTTMTDISSKIRQCVDEANLEEEEFLAVLAMDLWTLKDFLPDAINEIFEMNRQLLLKELHDYYREVRKIDDYAMRIGELFNVLITVRSLSRQMDVSGELYKLLDVIDEDELARMLEKAHIEGERNSAALDRTPSDPRA